jgi:hypothetical protein
MADINKENEIELIEIFIKINNFFKKYLFIILIFSILGLFTGLIKYNYFYNYNVSFDIKSYVLTQSELYHALEGLQSSIKSNNLKSIKYSSKINIIDELSCIKDMKIDTNTMQNSVKVNLLITKNNESANKIKTFICNYINSIPYYIYQQKFLTNQYTNMLNVINYKLSQIDSINKNSDNNQTKIKLQDLYTINTNNISIEYAYIYIYEKKLLYEQKLETIKEISYIVDNNINNILKQQSIKVIPVYIFYFFFIGICFSLFLEIKQMIRNYKKNENG